MLRLLSLEMNPGKDWIPVGVLNEDDQAGSISNNASGVREVIRFRWVGPAAVIDRSLAGADTEEGGPEGRTFRRIVTAGWETLATLFPGDEYHLLVMTDEMTKPVQMRWRYVTR